MQHIFIDANSAVLGVHAPAQNVPLAAYPNAVRMLALPRRAVAELDTEQETGLALKDGWETEFLADIKADARKGVVRFADAAAARLTGEVPQSEKDSWGIKGAAAAAHLAGAASDTQTAMLAAEADITGETVDDLAANIAAKSEAYLVVAGQIAGLRRATMAGIDAAPDVSIVFAVMDAAQIQGEAMLAAALAA